jgi:methylglutaconyl-CoA hydratase
MEFTKIIYEVGNCRARITLNRPEKHNALDDVMVKELITAFSMAGKDQATKVVILSAAGSSFCAGADLEYLSRVARYDLEENRADSQQLANLFRMLHELRKPVIAVVNGLALAGGCGLATVCDFVIASKENARFGYTEVRIGFIPAVVMIFLVKRVGEGKAREMVLRGNVIGAAEAQEIGLVSMVVPESDLLSTTDTLTEELIKQNSLTSMALCKEMLSKLHGMNLLDSLDFAANMNAAARMSPDCKEGIAAFLKKEKLEW